MNKKFLLTLATAIGITAAATNVVAAPLPNGTKLTIEKSTDGVFVAPPPGCTNGSCFGTFLFEGLFVWRPLGPGTDGGLIIGKGQKSGGQEIDPLSLNSGELTEAWLYGSYNGTFFTSPSDAGNVFDDQSCTGSGCGSYTTPRKTDLAVWNMAFGGEFGGETVSLGSAGGCNKMLLPACSADQVAGIFVKTWTIDPAGTVPRKYRLTYNQILPTVFTNFPFELILAGEVKLAPPSNIMLPTAADVTASNNYSWTPIVSSPRGTPLTCRIGTQAGNGLAGIAGDCSFGGYSPTQGYLFNQSDIFSYLANDGMADSLPGVVTVWGGPIYCSARSLPRISISTVTNTPVTWDFSSTANLVPGASAYCKLSLFPAVGSVTTDSASGCAGVYLPKPGYIGVDKFVYGFDYSYNSAPEWHFPEYCGGTAYGIVDVTVVPTPNLQPTVSNLSITTVSAQTATWKPAVVDPDGGPQALTCRIGGQPSNGAATVANDCSSGSYLSDAGFIGTDSFTYISNDGRDDSNAGTVTVAVTEPTSSSLCLTQYPVSQFSRTGKEGTLTITFTGNITSYANKTVKLCPGTTLKYQASSTKGPVVCKVKNNTTRGSGSLKINDHLKCTDKPAGKDKVHFKVKSGVNQKAI